MYNKRVNMQFLLLLLVSLPFINGMLVPKEDYIQGSLHCVSKALTQQGLSLYKLQGSNFIDCSELKYLNLTNNYIIVLENHVFKNLSNLRKIYLSSNMITALPTGIFSDTKELKEFEFYNNRITSLQRNLFANLLHLVSVNFQMNNISYIEENCFVNVPSLIALNLAFNNLKTLQFNIIDDISSLQIVYLTGNEWNCDPELCETMHTVVTKFWVELFAPLCHSPNGTKGATWKQVLDLSLTGIVTSVKDNPRASRVTMKCHTCTKSSLSWQLGRYLNLDNQATQTNGKYYTQSTLIVSDVMLGNFTCYVGNCLKCVSSSWVFLYQTFEYTNSKPDFNSLSYGKKVGYSAAGALAFLIGICCRIFRCWATDNDAETSN